MVQLHRCWTVDLQRGPRRSLRGGGQRPRVAETSFPLAEQLLLLPIWVGMKKNTERREEEAAFLMFSDSGKGNQGGVSAPQREAEWWGGRGGGEKLSL